LSEKTSDIALTPTQTASLEDEIVEFTRKPIMETLEAIKTILEIIAIFITFPQYAPVLAAILALGAAYYLLEDEDENNQGD
jgi:hypothetical protein